MTSGIVRNRHVFVEPSLAGPEGQAADVAFVLDRGFTSVTTLAPEACAALALPFLRLQPAGLADGSPLLLEVYQVALFWDGAERAVDRDDIAGKE